MNYLIFLPFLFFFPLYSYIAHLKLKKQNQKTSKTIKENILKMFRLDILVLIIIFVYFASYKNNTVDRMLFFMIYLYLFVNTLYEIPKKGKKNKNIKVILTYIILTIIPIIYYLITKNFIVTCYIMCSYTFFAYLIVLIVYSIIRKFFRSK